MDWKTFKVPFDSYFNGDAEHSSAEYEQMMFQVLTEIAADGGYYLDDADDVYQVKPLSEMPQPEVVPEGGDGEDVNG